MTFATFLLWFASLLHPLPQALVTAHTRGGGGSGCGTTTLFTDHFIAANSTDLNTYDSNWIEVNGGWDIQSDAIHSKTPGAVDNAAYNGVSPNNNSCATLTMTNQVTGKFIGPAIRASTTVATGYVCWGDTASSSLFADVAGSVTTIATGGPAFSNGDVIEVDANGTTITCKQNGATVLSGTDSNISSGKGGVFTFDSGPLGSPFVVGNL